MPNAALKGKDSTRNGRIGQKDVQRIKSTMGLFKSSAKSRKSSRKPSSSPPSSSTSRSSSDAPSPLSQPVLRTAEPAEFMSHATTSTSNLSTTPTLYEPPPAPPSHTRSARHLPPPTQHQSIRIVFIPPPLPANTTPYESFLHQARLNEAVRQRALHAATTRRIQDPAERWHGGFGLPVRTRPATGAPIARRSDARGWLARNGLVGR